MKCAISTSLARGLDALYQVGAIGGLSDRELLGRFTSQAGDLAERAFEAIVHRHGPMVLGVCRRAVRDEQTAEDTFQATFLVLAIKAGSIRRHEALGSWLHGVAARIARRARIRECRRVWSSLDALSLATIPGEVKEPEADAAELRAVLDEEIERLPAAYRRAVVLCYLEGKTQEAAALELGWTKGTISGRLARAKDLLRARLGRRGFAPSVGLIGVFLAGEEARSAVPAALTRDAVRAGLNAVLGRTEVVAAPGAVAALAGGVLRTMMLGKLATIVAALVVLITVSSTLARIDSGPGRTGPALPQGKQAATRPKSEPPAEIPPMPGARLPEHAHARLGTTRLRHESFLSNVTFAPDGRTLVSTGRDEAIRFWNPTTGEPAAKMAAIERAGWWPSVAYSPDGTRLAVGRYDFLQFLDLSTGKETFRTPILKGGVREIVFSPDGRILATAAEESEPAVRLWEADTGRLRRALSFGEPLSYRGRPMSFSPDGKRLAVAGTAVGGPGGKTEEIIGIWEIASDSRPIVIRNAHGHSLTSLAFSPDGKSLLSGGCDSQPTRDRRNPGEKLELSPKIRVRDAGAGRKIREFDMGSLEGHCAFTATPDRRTLISLQVDRLIVWALADAKMIRTIPIERYDPGVGIGGCLAVSPDGRILAAARGDNKVHLWDLHTGKPLLEQVGAHEGAVTASAIAPNGRLAATGDDSGMILLWDAARGEYVRPLELGKRGGVPSLCFGPDGRTLAGAARYFDPDAFVFRGLVRLWQTPGGALHREFRLDDDPVLLAYSPDGRQLAIALVNCPDPRGPRAAGSVDGIQVFDLATGLKRIGLRDRRGPVYAMDFGADGKTLMSVEADMRFRVWDLATSRVVKEIPIEGHRQGAKTPRRGAPAHLCVADLTPDLATAVTGAAFDDQLLVWDLATGRVQRTFEVGTYLRAQAAISPDGRLLAAAISPLVVEGGVMMSGPGRETTIRIWEIATKREVLRLEPKSSTVRSLAFAQDGKTLVSGMADTTVILWDCSAAHETPPRSRD